MEAVNVDRAEQFSMGKHVMSISEVASGTKIRVAMFSYCDALTTLYPCGSTSLSYNQVASVIIAVNIDRTERLNIGKQRDDIIKFE